MIPPVSPYGLLQETLWPSEWQILVACVLLNQTQRKQVERVLPDFIDRWPTPQQFLQAKPGDVCEVIRRLGFSTRRTDLLFQMTRRYLCGPWRHARELPGIGEYGAACHEIFCRGNVPIVLPNDHALKQYVIWYNQLVGIGQ
jgi:adenine-specific DNA glycosylase